MSIVTGFLDELTTSTRRHIMPGLIDQYGKNDPFFAYLKKNNFEKFPGGAQIQENIVFDYLQGGSYSKGQTFNIDTKQTETGATFFVKHYYVNVTLFKEDIQIFNKGPEQVFSLVDAKMQNAGLSMSARLAIDAYNEGQSASRATKLNGMAEALNDGSNNSWTGAAYSTYGTLSRSANGGNRLVSPMTGPTAQVSGPLTYKILEETYNSIVLGDEYPNLIVTTNLGMSYVKEKFQPQWRTETQDPNIGFNGIKFNSAMVIQSQYAPGTAGVNDSNIGNYYVSTGETMFFLNTKYWRLYVTSDPEFGFGFSGFKPAQDSTTVAGQHLFTGNMTCQAPRLNRHLFDITG